MIERYERRTRTEVVWTLRLLAAAAAARAARRRALGCLPRGPADAGRRLRGAGPRRRSDTTAWAALGLVAARRRRRCSSGGVTYLARGRAGGDDADRPRARTRSAASPWASGRPPRSTGSRPPAPGTLVNATIWTILALRQAGRPAPPALVKALARRPTAAGGWCWTKAGAPDSNDTAAAIQALRAAACLRQADRAWARLPAGAAERRRRLRARIRPRLGRAVDGVGDPGFPRRRPQARCRRAALPGPAAPAGRQLPLQRPLRDDAGLGDGPGAAGAGGQAVPAQAIALRAQLGEPPVPPAPSPVRFADGRLRRRLKVAFAVVGR